MINTENKNLWLVVVAIVAGVFILSNFSSITGEAKLGRLRAQCNDNVDNDCNGYCDFA